MSKLKTGTKDAAGEVILLDKNEAASIYAKVNRSRLHLLTRLDEIDLADRTDKHSRSHAIEGDPPEVQLLFVLNQQRMDSVDSQEQVNIAKLMRDLMKDMRSEANRASAELGTLLMQQAKQKDIPTMAEVLKASNT